MGINDSYLSLSSYRINEIPRVSYDEPATQIREDDRPVNVASMKEETVADNRPRSLNPSEVSVSKNMQETFAYIGRDRDPGLLDISRAISDMKQETVLRNYQYFVGNNRSVFESEDGTVIATN